MALSNEDTDSDDKEELMAGMLAERIDPPAIQGEIIHRGDFPSKLIRPRPVDVWLPEGYHSASGDRYPVIYMHDGQMMFNHITSPYAGMDLFWDVDKAITRLVRDGESRPSIVVAIWMADWTKGARGAEYMPQKPATDEVLQSMKATGDSFATEDGGENPSADNYLRFIVEELKPFVDVGHAAFRGRGSFAESLARAAAHSVEVPSGALVHPPRLRVTSSARSKLTNRRM